MSFFHIDEKTLADLIRNQKEREKQPKEIEPEFEYDGHKLIFMQAADGAIVIDATPSLVKEIEGDVALPAEGVDTWTQVGWVRKP